ncbi:MAG: hypothetical protein QM689_08855 [Oscillospiraceae bacterium]
MILEEMLKNTTEVKGSVDKVKNTCGITIVNTKGNGKRIQFSKELISKLNNCNGIRLNYGDDYIIIIPDENGMKLSKGNVLYNSVAVEEIANKYKLDFEKKTSCSFEAKVEKDEKNESIIFAVVYMR